MACVKLPKIPAIPSITLLGGAELKGVLDFSQGTPTDCKLTFNLLLQLSPLLASMACLLKVLNVIGKLQDFLGAFPNLADAATKAKPVLDAITELSMCIPALVLPQMALMVKGMLSLIINFLSCFLSQLDSIIRFQATIDLKAAEGNPVLFEALICARNNAQTSMENLMLSIQPLQPILGMIKAVAGIAKLPITLPDFSSVSAGQDQMQVIASLRQGIDTIKDAINSIPG
jgi:hypothetical protein